MVIFARYFIKEMLKSQGAVLLVLMLIFFSQHLIRVFAKAAGGDIPGQLITSMMILYTPYIMLWVLPISFYIGILFCLGRFYADSEMTVIYAVGTSRRRILWLTLLLGVLSLFVTAFFTLYVAPQASFQEQKLLQDAKQNPGFSILRQGQFIKLGGDRYVAHVDKLTDKGSKMQNVFIVSNPYQQQQLSVVMAKSGELYRDKDDRGIWLALNDGNRYSGTPGQAVFDISQFQKYQTLIRQKTVNITERALDAKSSSSLLHGDKNAIAELQWRLSVPLAVLVLGLIAVPLAEVNPRQGRYAKLLPSLLIYLAYFLFLSSTRSAVGDGRWPAFPGMFIIPFAFALLIALPLNLRYSRWWLRTRERFIKGVR